MPQHTYARLALALCILAAVFYNSWPLGYVLNNQTVHMGLASDLEQAGQPYYWVFVLGDILTALCVVAVCTLIWLKFRHGLHTKTWAIVCTGLLFFGLGTAIAAVVPAHCSINATLSCGVNGSLGLGLDALFSIIAAVGLIVSLAAVCILDRRYGMSTALLRITQASLVAWSASGILFTLFALSSGKAAEAQFVQLIFLILYGLVLIVIGLNVDAALRRRPVRSR